MQYTSSRFIFRFAIATLIMLSISLGVRAQGTTEGAIGGTVMDSTGAVVPKAQITVHSNATNAEKNDSASDSGNYRVTNLQPGSYTVTITAPNFSPYQSKDVIVQVGLTTDISPKLGLGTVASEVIVTAPEAPEVNTTSPDFAPIVDNVAISNLPINGGRWSDFALLTPGVVNDSSGFGLLSVRGQSTLMNNNTIDGADNNQAFFSEERGRTRAGYSSAKAAVQEFQVNTANYSSEYGRATGAVINTVTKSGTNELHGEGYFYDRDNAWGAANAFTTMPVQTSPGVFTSTNFKPVDRRLMYGFGVGGPIIKDKLFFFLAFDRYDRNFPGFGVASNPTAFFAALCPSNQTAGTFCANQVTVAQHVARLPVVAGCANTATPPPGCPTAAQEATALTDYNNVLAFWSGESGNVARKGTQNIFFPKLDWNITSRNHASFEFNSMRWYSPNGIQTSGAVFDGIASFGNDWVRDTWGVARLDTYFTNNLTNEFRFQYGRDFEFEHPQAPTTAEQNVLLKNSNFPGYTNPLGLPPDVFVTNGFDIGVPTFLDRPAYPDERRQQYSDTVIYAKGKHAIKFGVDFTHVNDNTQNLRFQYGSFSYTNLVNFTSDFFAPNSCGGTATAAGTTQCYTSYNQAFGPLGVTLATDDLGFFVQDDWKILPHFTLNLGLRWDKEFLPKPFPNLVNPAVPQTGIFPSNNHDFGPRVGFAWDIYGTGKSVLRGGYGIYYGRIINSAIYNAMINTGLPTGQLQYTFSGGSLTAGPAFPEILNAAPTGATTAKPAVVYFDPNFKLPETQEMDLTYEQQIGWNTVLSVSYLGSLGRHLPDFIDTNIGPSTSNISYIVVDPTGTGPLKTGTTVTLPLYSTRLNANFNSMTDIISGVNSNYQAGVLQLNHRLSNSVQFNMSYTWSHSLDYGENATTFTDTNDVVSPGNVKAEYGNSIFNIPNRFVGSAVIRSWWRKEGWVDKVVGGWELAPIYQAQNGLPYSLTTSGSAPGSLPGGGGPNGSGGKTYFLGRDTYHLPNTKVLDVRLSKRFTFHDRYTIEAIGEAFNIFNHQNYTSSQATGYFVSTSAIQLPGGASQACSAAAPCLNFNYNSSTFAPVFGTLTNSNSNFAYSPRQIQIAFRFLF